MYIQWCRNFRPDKTNFSIWINLGVLCHWVQPGFKVIEGEKSYVHITDAERCFAPGHTHSSQVTWQGTGVCPWFQHSHQPYNLDIWSFVTWQAELGEQWQKQPGGGKALLWFVRLVYFLLFSQYLMSAYYVSETILGVRKWSLYLHWSLLEIKKTLCQTSHMYLKTYGYLNS